MKETVLSIPVCEFINFIQPIGVFCDEGESNQTIINNNDYVADWEACEKTIMNSFQDADTVSHLSKIVSNGLKFNTPVVVRKVDESDIEYDPMLSQVPLTLMDGHHRVIATIIAQRNTPDTLFVDYVVDPEPDQYDDEVVRKTIVTFQEEITEEQSDLIMDASCISVPLSTGWFQSSMSSLHTKERKLSLIWENRSNHTFQEVETAIMQALLNIGAIPTSKHITIQSSFYDENNDD